MQKRGDNLSQTQLGVTRIGASEVDDQLPIVKRDAQIHIIDRLTDTVLNDIQVDEFWDELRTRDLNGLDIFDFVTFADKTFSQYLKGERGLIIPAREGGYAEFIIKENKQTEDRNRYIFSEGSFIEIAKKKIIEPGTYTGTPQQLINMTMNGIAKWKVGEVAYATVRTIQVEERITAYQMLKRIASAFEYDLKFRIEVSKGKIIRFVDLVEKIGAYRGHEIEFGHNMESIERHENTRDIVTALNVFGPPDENGIRKHVFVFDDEAKARWSTDGEHLVEDYYPETLDQDITEERLTTLGENELAKRVNAIVTYRVKMVDLEKEIGEEVHFGDEVRSKDEGFNPPLYLAGRIHTMREDLKGIVPTDVDFGDFEELSVEDAFTNFRKLQEEMAKKITEAEHHASIGDIKYTLISYKELLNVEKSSIDSRFESLNNNLDLSDAIQANLSTAKTNYNNAYNMLLNTINIKAVLEELSDADLQEVNIQYANYNKELSSLTGQFEMATNDISQKKANDAESNAKKHTNDSLVSVNEAIGNAQSTADGKNTIILSPSEPTVTGRKIHDVWFDTDDGNKMYRFDGSKWVAAQFGENAIVANSITANHIKSLIGLNINNQFVVDANGNVKFAGNLEGASGTFKGKLVSTNGVSSIELDGNDISVNGRPLFHSYSTLLTLMDGNQSTPLIQGLGKIYAGSTMFSWNAGSYDTGYYIEKVVNINDFAEVAIGKVTAIIPIAISKEWYAYEPESGRVFSDADLYSFKLRLSPHYNLTETSRSCRVDFLIIGWR